MGRKYASIHIYNDDIENILILIRKNYNNKTDLTLWTDLLDEMKLTNLRGYNQLLSHLKVNGNVLIIKNDVYISLYDESNTFESIQSKVKEISLKLDSLVTYTSNFDDDVFLIGAYKSGKQITSGKFGVDLPVYGMRRKRIDMDKFCQSLQINSTEELNSINSLDNISDIEDILEKQLQINLNLYLEEVVSSESYIEIYSDDTFHVYCNKY